MLIVSLQDLALHDPKPEMTDQFHWINHLQPSPTGSRIAFFHLWRVGENGWGVRLYVCRPNGAELSYVLDTGRISHYDWLDESQLLVWARRPEGGERFLLVDVSDASHTVFGEGVLTEDGHDSFSPDRRWLLNDTYPDRHDMRTLMLVGWPHGQRIDIGRTYSPKSIWWGEIRCDLHPRWSRDGRQVCVDSVHDGSRQMYVIDVSRWVA
jgi:Tol biopolymer transport system component